MKFILEVINQSWAVMSEMAAYLLFGFFMAGLLSVLISRIWVQTHLGGSGFRAVLKAALFGVPLPLCSCGVIPVTAGLRKFGAGKPAAMSFLLATPETGADSIMATWGLMGPALALFRAATAFIMGLVGGALSLLFDREQGAPAEAPEPVSAATARPPALLRALRYGFIVIPRDIGRPVLLGLLAAGLIGALVPENYFAERIESPGLQMLAMLALGVPLYMCSTGSLPIAAALVAKGISPGAALVFLISGPATNMATIAVVLNMFGRRALVIYLGTIAASALLAGVLFDSLFSDALQNMPVCHVMETGTAYTNPAAWILLALLLPGLFKKR